MIYKLYKLITLLLINIVLPYFKANEEVLFIFILKNFLEQVLCKQ